MRMLKNIIISVVALVATCQIGSAQYQNDGKGISYNQLYGCCDTAGVKLDSMFRMTDTLGKLSICLSIQNLIDIINEYDTTGGGGGGSSSFGCDSVLFCLTEEGLLCEALGDFGTATYVSGDKVIGVTAGGECRQFDLFAINGFGDTVRLVNNADGSYTLRNENNTGFTFGYMLNCINDSTFALTDWDGTPVDTCVIKGGLSTGGGGGSVDCDSVKACVSTFLCDSVQACLEEGLLCELLGALPEVGTDAGQKYVVIDELGNCELVDSVYIDVCGVLTEIQDESQLMESDYLFIQRNNDCYRVPWYVEGTDCVELDMQGGILTSTIIVDPAPGANFAKVFCGANGLYAEKTNDTLDCETLSALFVPGILGNTDSLLASNGVTCEKIAYAELFGCEAISEAFAPGEAAGGDSVLVNSSSGECKKVALSDALGEIDCETISSLFIGGSQISTDSILVSDGANCKKVAASNFTASGCPDYPEVDEDAAPFYVMVQYGVDTANLSCGIIPWALLQTLPAATAPFAPTELKKQVNEAVEEKLNNMFSYNPSALTNKASEVDYPTVNNMGIRTFKTKIEAEKDSTIPLGGIYYIEGKETISVKTKQR